MKQFGDESRIYEDIDVLDPNTDTYLPENLPEREEELDELHDVLKPVVEGGKPRNALVYGPTGQGKTVGINLKTSGLENWARQKKSQGEDVKLTVAHVSCEGANGSYQALSSTIKTMREIRNGPGEEAPVGHHQKKLLEMLIDEMEEIGGTIILVLDEIDGIGDDDYMLYELPRASLDGAKLGIIGITNDLNFRQNLAESTRSSLGKREVHFASYNANQLRDILSRRAAGALRDTYFDGDQSADNLVSDVLESGVIPLCASLAAQESGDARHAIELLSHACDYADRPNVKVVTEGHVREAHDRIETQAMAAGIASAPIQRQLALLSVVYQTAKGNEWTGTADLYENYKNLCDVGDADVLAYRTFDEKLGDLSGFGILEKKKTGRGKSGGVTNRYNLSLDVNTALGHLDGDGHERISDVVTVVRNSY